MHKAGIIRGDGIGPEISEAAQQVVEASGAKIDWVEILAGESAGKECGEALPLSEIRKMRDTGVLLKAPLMAGRCTGGVVVTENGETRRHPSINNGLRRELGLFVNVRPVRGFQGVSGAYSSMDIVIMREITEDMYSGLETQIDDGCAEAIKRITAAATRRIAQYSCEYARKFGRSTVSAIHKANVLHLTDGLFLKTVRSTVESYPDLRFDETAIDAACYLLVKQPRKFDVMVLPNQYGDILSDVAAGLVGSLGLAPGGNIGPSAAMFEAAHGAAPDIAGKGLANPIGLILSGAMLLDHIGEAGAAGRVRTGVAHVLEKGTSLTPDLGGSATTGELTSAIVSAIRNS